MTIYTLCLVNNQGFNFKSRRHWRFWCAIIPNVLIRYIAKNDGHVLKAPAVGRIRTVKQAIRDYNL